MSSSKISLFSRVLIGLAAVALVVSIFVPLWRIELDAPQYPEGLCLNIYPNLIGGDVDIINGLNHYIGMQTLHAENFIEFTLLPYIIGFYALLVFSAAMIGRRNYVNFVLIAFILFGIVAMVDFWRWEYDYGHNLNPDAAIKVPGMAYQPPLIGFKQLLNFGAYSVPDIGGWLFIFAGVVLVFVAGKEGGWYRKFFKKNTASIVVILASAVSVSSCGQKGPEPIHLNKDKCDFCKMTISDYRFAAELITPKGRVYKFDDLSCMSGYIQENREIQNSSFYIGDFKNAGTLLGVMDVHFVQSDEFKSPMGGNTAAFKQVQEAEKMAQLYRTVVKNWKQVQNQN